MQRKREQQGYLYQRAGSWVLRYRTSVTRKDATGALRLVRVQRAEVLASVAQYPNEGGLRKSQLFKDRIARATPTNAKGGTMRLGDFVEANYFPDAIRKLRTSTYRNYQNKWRAYLAPYCADWWLSDIGIADIEGLLADIEQEHHLAKATMSHLKWLLSAIFIRARKEKLYNYVNPVPEADLPKTRRKAKPHACSLQEVRYMITSLPEPAATAVATAAYSGLRKGEIQGLEWPDYDGESLTVRRSIWNGVVDDCKTDDSQARVPVIPQLKAMLDAHRTACGSPANGPIFSNASGNPACLQNMANRIILPILHRCRICGKAREEHRTKKAEAGASHRFELERKVWHGWHAFRRGLATTLYELGTPDKTIQDVLRHSNLKTTLEVYVQARKEKSAQAMCGTLAAAVSEVSEAESPCAVTCADGKKPPSTLIQ